MQGRGRIEVRIVLSQPTAKGFLQSAHVAYRHRYMLLTLLTYGL